MAYSTVADVRRALAPSLTSFDDPPDPKSNTPADLSNDTITDAIAEADSRIDPYLSGQYVTPIALVGDTDPAAPAPVRYWSRDLAAYLCLTTYRKSQDINPNDPIRLRVQDVIAEMTAVRAGTAHLALTVNDTTVNESGGALPPINIGYSGTMFPPDDFDLTGPVFPSPRWSPFDALWHDRWL